METTTVTRTSLDGHEDGVRRLTRAYFTEVNTLGSEWFDDESYGVDIPAVVESDLARRLVLPRTNTLNASVTVGASLTSQTLHLASCVSPSDGPVLRSIGDFI